MSFNMYVPTRFIFGCGRLNELHEQKLPGKKAMVVISNGKSTKENGSLDRTIEELTRAGVERVVFDKVQANPLKSTVIAGVKTARDNGCDFIVALGGGSVMDASKAMAAMATNDGDIWDYISGGTGKGKAIVNAPLPVICITTTAGTGSEADQWGVITNDETNEKIGFGGGDRLFPVISIIDPELMRTVPTKFTAYQGFDALFHSTESYISKFASLMSDMYALTAIENAAKYLPRAVKDGSDMEAREHMAFANTLSGVVMTVSVTTAEHSIEHAMSAYHQELPHGAGLIMISKAFYEFFIDKHACDERFIAMAKAMGIKEADKPDDFITVLVDLQKTCGVAELRMSDYGITPDEFDKIATNARETMGGLFAANPCEMTHKDVVDVLRNSYR
ncbi:iron-containing alcohol dehydrogenase [Clostridium tagluense]|uniref:iron-containing alcohol dehydrogenase n=1 Tax=Clostridium tagluense TaxID=360422 RepID=UPI001CF390A0|nr:iron-containing alcohol dehydrogenase [Clostridium tagluense]MCB2311915.1 iron-containing alcohol dehydrogenase [Clostridium tagluense]MCB2317332.1 iron-containing alcohol dehydrogenase [Clostridium tagluense]MCB2322879.1 iron-containing alcohol dehydrogenase [Clostridium tagluense]MCB2326886.1 iron-containing alcohol dehydrogenase [Clostridium tagluense]MCB2332517.1 iron-containing alcohol dehydrogenase [Clostridium tagluense]